MCKAYKAVYEIITEKGCKPVQKTYSFSGCYDKRIAFKIANDVLCDYIVDMHFYSGSIKKLAEIK